MWITFRSIEEGRSPIIIIINIVVVIEMWIMWITHSNTHKYYKNSVDNYVDNFYTYPHSYKHCG